jgi:predicted molibdopterin-dependent oxidoreductase YjgC
MPELIAVTINGIRSEVVAGTTIAAAMLLARQACRISVLGEGRTALCGMGICFECRAMVDGVPHRRTCQTVCTAGMMVETNP